MHGLASPHVTLASCIIDFDGLPSRSFDAISSWYQSSSIDGLDDICGGHAIGEDEISIDHVDSIDPLGRSIKISNDPSFKIPLDDSLPRRLFGTVDPYPHVEHLCTIFPAL